MQSLFLTAAIVLTALAAGESRFDYSKYDAFLRTYVENGLVDYSGIKSDDTLLDDYLQELQRVDAEQFRTLSQDEQNAFWINAYNAITIEGIVRNYPIEPGGFFARKRFPDNSIRQIDDFWGTVFVKVMGDELTLDDIEHEILRKQFKDPRIHFVLVCAALGCPLLENRAFLPQYLDDRLDGAASGFISNPEKVRLDRKKNTLYLSSILKWYKEDFVFPHGSEQLYERYNTKDRGIVEFVARYMPQADREFIIEHHPKLKFLDYDWTLNEKY
jgi:hypothetical protein